MRVEAIQASFVRALGPELGMRMGQSFFDPAKGQEQLQAFLGSLSAAFPKTGLQAGAAQVRPRPFSPTDGGVVRNPMMSLMQASGQPATGAANGLKGLVGQMDQMIATLSGGQGAASSASAASAGGSQVRATSGGGGWGNIDSLMSQAEQLMQSDKQSDQLQGQMLMMKAMRLFEMVSKMMEQQSQLAAKAIQAIR